MPKPYTAKPSFNAESYGFGGLEFNCKTELHKAGNVLKPKNAEMGRYPCTTYSDIFEHLNHTVPERLCRQCVRELQPLAGSAGGALAESPHDTLP